ncbi:hypothetical protein [Arenibacter sp. GZD-96]|nr:hypothetical protein [Arenibacter sp. GZD-96]
MENVEASLRNHLNFSFTAIVKIGIFSGRKDHSIAHTDFKAIKIYRFNT